MHRAIALLVTAALGVAACSADSAEVSTDDATVTVAGQAVRVDQIPGDKPTVGISALDSPSDPGLPPPLLDPTLLRSGGPPPDGIPPVDSPIFFRVGDIDFVSDDEPVLVLTANDETRIYPIQIMIWHEIVNDTVGGVPVSVTYCPLCNSAIAFDRRTGDRILDFGTSGMLYNSALVMYDRQSESLWSHFTGEAVIGALVGTRLDVLPVSTVSWADAIASAPDALVLSKDTGFSREYGRNPYPGYDDVSTSPFLFSGDTDPRLPAKTRMVGVEDRSSGGAVAVLLEPLATAGVIEIELGGRTLSVWHLAGTSSALDRGTVDKGNDVGATGVFVAEVDGQPATFQSTADGFVDDVTRSTWNILGEAIAGPAEGTRLESIAHVDTFWFAWAAFLPDSEIVDA